MVEVAGVEPASETESVERLRVYPAVYLGQGMPAGGLIPVHPLDSAPCGGRTEPPAAWPAKLCLGAQQTSALRHGGLYLGGQTVIVVRNYSFSSFFTWPTRIHDAQPDLDTSRRNRITPIWLVRVLYHKLRSVRY